MKTERSSLVFVVGLSGAGKSTASKALSDLGMYAIENLPVGLLEPFLEHAEKNFDKFRQTSILLDIATDEQSQALVRLLSQEPPKALSDSALLFLDCSTESIIRRYSETRRPHPGFEPTMDKTLAETVLRERTRLQPLKELAQLVLDTSDFSSRDLKRAIEENISDLSPESKRILHVNFLSFGFKNGLPRDCDLIIDVRFLNNPFYIDALRNKTGLDQEVRDYVLSLPEALEFIKRYADLLDYLLPLYAEEGKSYLNIGVGCTGGAHRSVSLAEELPKHLRSSKLSMSVKHRDLPSR